MKKYFSQRIPSLKNRIVCFTIDVVLSFFYKLLFPFDSKKPLSLINKDQVKTILVFRLDGIGDLVLSTPIFPLLRRAFPDAKIVLAVPDWSVLTANLIKDIDEIVVVNLPWVVGRTAGCWTKLLRAISGLRHRKFDLSFEIRGDFRILLLQRLINARSRVGFGISGCEFALTHKVKISRGIHPVELIRDIARDLLPEQEVNLTPAIEISEKMKKSGEAILNDVGLKLSDAKSICVVIHPGARWPGRQWCAQKNAALADRLIECGFQVVFTGVSSEEKFVNEIKALMKNKPFCLVGKTDFHSFLGILASVDLFFGVDSGPMHLASALGTPVLALFGPASPEVVGPRGRLSKTIDFCRQYPCSPCAQTVCSKNKSCMNSIELDYVWQEVKSLVNIVQSGKDKH